MTPVLMMNEGSRPSPAALEAQYSNADYSTSTGRETWNVLALTRYMTIDDFFARETSDIALCVFVSGRVFEKDVHVESK
jgi:hypothetical protein